ncbi:MAG: 2'-5' RNA ligase family protein [Saprospiraceae bacterium]
MADAIYFIAILVEGEAGETITGFKQDAAQQFGASRALNSPPHLTLIPPFTWPATQLEALSDALSGFMALHPAPVIRLHNFNCFPPRVIYVDVKPNPELTSFQHALETHLEQQLSIRTDRQYGFHPHVTIAFKDLREAVFPEAWAYFSTQTFTHTFQAPGIALLQHTGQCWEVKREFPTIFFTT